jgi:hypothetical protein
MNDTVDHVRSSSASRTYVGLWATEDGYIRQTLSADGRYDEARGPRLAASSGRYSVENDRIEYVEDASGFTASGRFEDGVLYHAGMVLYRRNGESQPS